LIFLSINYIKNEDLFITAYNSFFEVAVASKAAVILGGQALYPELRSRLFYASCGDRMAHLAEFARRFMHELPVHTNEAIGPGGHPAA
jgi:hypothetical protein